MNNRNHKLSTMAIIGFAVSSTLYVESKSRTPEERQRLFFNFHAIITAFLITRFIVEASVSRTSKEKQVQKKQQHKNILNFNEAKERATDTSTGLHEKSL